MKTKFNLLSGLLVAVLLHFFCTAVFVYAYDNVTVHRKINKKAGESSILGEYLKTGLGYSSGVQAVFVGERAWQWLSDGGFEEDDPAPNVCYHFHDPMEELDNAGIFQPWSMEMTGSAL